MGNMISHTRTRTQTHTHTHSTAVNRCSSHMAVWTPDHKQPQRSKCKCHC